MTRKHFQQIAAQVARQVAAANGDKAKLTMLRDLARDLADVCKLHNPNFNRESFLHACGTFGL